MYCKWILYSTVIGIFIILNISLIKLYDMETLGYYPVTIPMQQYFYYVSIHLSHISIWCFSVHDGN